ncbi:MAG TPA: c-type cytochrome [Planctomycetota bacterium]|nr:c-type cytochrome [Planctomycetota bacterium]
MRHSTKLVAGLLVLLGILPVLLTPSCGDEIEPGDVTRGKRIARTKCAFCHFVEGSGGMIAPPLEKGIETANAQLREYEKRIEALKLQFPKAYAAEQPKIDAVLAEKDPAKRWELWLKAYMTDTKFDNPLTKMGNVLMTEQDRADVIAWLATKRPASCARARAASRRACCRARCRGRDPTIPARRAR